MNKQKYDVVFGLGAACRTSMSLRAANLQHSSFPYDWVMGASIRRRTDMLVGDFLDFLRYERLTEVETPSYYENGVWRDSKTDIHFVLDFPKRRLLKDEFPVVKSKYDRRAKRLLDQLSRAKRILVVWVDASDSSTLCAGDLSYCRGCMLRKWPHADVDVLAFKYAKGMPLPKTGVEMREGVALVEADYKDPSDDDAWLADHFLLSRWLRKRYEVVDLRTDEERARYDELQRRRKYERFHATSCLDYLLTKLTWKLYRHCSKRLARKGVI